MELGPQNHNGDGLLGTNSIIVVYMDPLGSLMEVITTRPTIRSSRQKAWPLGSPDTSWSNVGVLGQALPTCIVEAIILMPLR